MAYPGDPSGPAQKGSASFAGGRLTADDFDQLAAAFRPSWEFDEAPFVGAGTMSPTDLHALQGGGGTHADIRAAAQAPVVNGAHAPAKPAAAAHEPEDSVIIDRSVTAEVRADVRVADVAPPPAPVQARIPVVAPAVAVRAPTSPDRLAQTRIVQRAAVIPVARESTGSFDARALRSKRPLWIGLGAGGLALIAVGIWAASGSSAAPAPAPPVIVTKSVQTAAPDIPPPPPDTTPAPITPPPRTIPISALAQVPVAAAPPAPAPVRPA